LGLHVPLLPAKLSSHIFYDVQQYNFARFFLFTTLDYQKTSSREDIHLPSINFNLVVLITSPPNSIYSNGSLASESITEAFELVYPASQI
jgi:hypothetical protein